MAIEEKIVVVLNRDGGLDNLEVKGDLILRISEADKSRVRLNFIPIENSAIQFKVFLLLLLYILL